MESLESLTILAVKTLILLLGLIILATILLSGIDISEQLTFANVEKLRAAIDQVCLTGQPVENLEFSMGQSMPSMWWTFGVIPKWIIKMDGDPSYVLYYESFPPGEAIGWETYHGFDYRLISNLPFYSTDIRESDVKDFAENVKTKYKETHDIGKLEAVTLGNVILHDAFNGTVYKRAPEPAYSSGTAPGKWKEKAKLEEKDSYVFNNYVGMSNLERAALKYQPCGDDALCLKTLKGVYRYPLKYCSDVNYNNNIDYIQLVYEARGVKTEDLKTELKGLLESVTGITVIRFLSIEFGALALGAGVSDIVVGYYNMVTSYKVSDFYLASPCTVEKLKIEKTDCQDEFKCTRMTSYPVYQYNNGQFTNIYQYNNGQSTKKGEHQACLDNVLGTDQPNAGNVGGTTNCIRISVLNERVTGSNFCWTPNPYVDPSNTGFFDKFFPFLKGKQTADIWTIFVGEKIAGVPVTELTDFSNDYKTFTLFPKERQESYKGLFGEFTWSWP